LGWRPFVYLWTDIGAHPPDSGNMMQTLIDLRVAYWVGAAISFWVLWRFVWDYGPLICL